MEKAEEVAATLPRAASDDALFERAASRFDQPATSSQEELPVPRSATDGALLSSLYHLDIHQQRADFCAIS
eukprot:3508807-Prymnesium_polylepis.1